MAEEKKTPVYLHAKMTQTQLSRAIDMGEHTLLEIEKTSSEELEKCGKPLKKEQARLLKGVNTRSSVSESDMLRLSWISHFLTTIKARLALAGKHDQEDAKKSRDLGMFKWTGDRVGFEDFRAKWKGQEIMGRKQEFLDEAKKFVIRIRGKSTPRYLVKTSHGMAMVGRASTLDFNVLSFNEKCKWTKVIELYSWEFDSYDVLVCEPSGFSDKFDTLKMFNVYIPRYIRIE